MSMEIDHRRLLSIAEKTAARMSQKKEIFPLREIPMDRRTDWDGNDFDRFLDFCERNASPFIYVSKWDVTESNVEQDERFSAHIGELVQIQVAFLHDGYFHTYSEATDLFKEFCRDLTDEPASEGPAEGAELDETLLTRIKDCILGLREEQITGEFIKEFMESNYREFRFEYRLYEFICKKHGLSGVDPMTLNSLDREVENAFSKFRTLAEERLIENLVPQLIEWSAKNKRKKILKVDVQVFLSENHIKLDNPSITILWRKADYQFRDR